MANTQHLRRSPLAARSEELQASSSPAASIRERPFVTQVGIRAEPGPDGYVALAEDLGGLPTVVGEVIGDATSPAVLWLSPAVFLVLDSLDRELATRLTHVLAARFGHVLVLSAYLT